MDFEKPPASQEVVSNEKNKSKEGKKMDLMSYIEANKRIETRVADLKDEALKAEMLAKKGSCSLTMLSFGDSGILRFIDGDGNEAAVKLDMGKISGVSWEFKNRLDQTEVIEGMKKMLGGIGFNLDTDDDSFWRSLYVKKFNKKL